MLVSLEEVWAVVTSGDRDENLPKKGTGSHEVVNDKTDLGDDDDTLHRKTLPDHLHQGPQPASAQLIYGPCISILQEQLPAWTEDSVWFGWTVSLRSEERYTRSCSLTTASL